MPAARVAINPALPHNGGDKEPDSDINLLLITSDKQDLAAESAICDAPGVGLEWADAYTTVRPHNSTRYRPPASE